GSEKGSPPRKRSSPHSLRAREFGRRSRPPQSWLPNRQPPTIFSSLFSLIFTSHRHATASCQIQGQCSCRAKILNWQCGVDCGGKNYEAQSEKIRKAAPLDEAIWLLCGISIPAEALPSSSTDIEVDRAKCLAVQRRAFDCPRFVP